MLTISIVGFGSRGQMFGRKIMADENVKLLAVAETVEVSREHAAEFGVAPEMRFASADEFFAQGKVSGTIDADVEETKPERTKEFLKENIKKVSSFKTVSRIKLFVPVKTL